MNREEIISAIESMTVLELADLVKELEEKFGVSAAAPVAVAAAPAAAFLFFFRLLHRRGCSASGFSRLIGNLLKFVVRLYRHQYSLPYPTYLLQFTSRAWPTPVRRISIRSQRLG